jgi:hypothetical protein
MKQAACLPGGFGIMVRMIFIVAPHTDSMVFTDLTRKYFAQISIAIVGRYRCFHRIQKAV